MEIGVHITCTGRNFRLSLKSHITTVHIKDFIHPREVIVHFVLKPERWDIQTRLNRY